MGSDSQLRNLKRQFKFLNWMISAYLMLHDGTYGFKLKALTARDKPTTLCR
jgi:hypothetical protein